MRLPTRTALATLVVLALGACSGSESSKDTANSAKLSIVGFAVPEAANKAIADEWTTTPEGKDVTFRTSYGPSGDQSRAVVDGLEADYVHFSVTSDVTRLVKAGLVAETWDDGPDKGIVSSSVVVFAVRSGNPKGIKDWDDLVKPGIQIVTPNPASSGAARWNALAAWGQVIDSGGSEADGRAYLDKFFSNVIALPSSGRDATAAFLGGAGDVLMAYENEAIFARQKGEKFDYVIPSTTLRIENPGAVLIDAAPKAQAWLDYVLGPQGQKQFAVSGFRPVIDGIDYGDVAGANDPANPYPEVETLLTIGEDFESWEELTPKFFDEEKGIVNQAIAASGKGQ